MYQISSRTGWRHRVDADMPDGDTVGRMWRGHELPTAACGRRLQPVNFYEADDTTAHPAYRCSGCFKAAGRSG